MPDYSKYAQSGFLSGLGKGMQQVGNMRYQTQRDEAADLRKRSLMEYGWNRDDKVRAADQAREDTIRADDREYAEGNVDTYRDVVDKDGNPVTVGRSSRGETITTDGRAPTATEYKVDNPDGPGAGKYDSPLHKDARSLLFDDVFVNYTEKIKAATGEDFDLDKMMVQFLDPETGRFNRTAVKAKLSELGAGDIADSLYEELTQKQQMVEAMVEKGIRPAAAVAKANKEYKAVSEKVKTGKNAQQLEGLSTQFGIPVDQLKKAKAQMVTPEFVEKAAIAFNKDRAGNKKDLAAFKLTNEPLFNAIMERADMLQPETDSYENPSKATIDKVYEDRAGKTNWWDEEPSLEGM